MSEQKPNKEEYAAYRFRRAKETIKEIQVLIDNRFWNTAISRMYYCCYYAVCALHAFDEVRTSTHSGVKQKFGQLYVKTGIIDRKFGKIYSDLFEKRHKGDYNDFFDYDEETINRFYPEVVLFVEQIEKVLKEKGSF